MRTAGYLRCVQEDLGNYHRHRPHEIRVRSWQALTDTDVFLHLDLYCINTRVARNHQHNRTWCAVAHLIESGGDSKRHSAVGDVE